MDGKPDEIIAILEEKNKHVIAMKTLAAGEIEPETAFQYITNHNICAVTIGMVTKEQAEESTRIALKSLINKNL